MVKRILKAEFRSERSVTDELRELYHPFSRDGCPYLCRSQLGQRRKPYQKITTDPFGKRIPQEI